MRKLLFFDIDGTLLPFFGHVLPSTSLALSRAREEGHLLFLCTGRSEHQIPEEVAALGFDGVISAAGATITYGEELLFSQQFGPRVEKLVRVLEADGAIYTIQTRQASYSPYRCKEWAEKHRRAWLPIHYEAVDEAPERYSHGEKAVFQYSPSGIAWLSQALAPEFTLTASSLDVTDTCSGEIAMTGITKSSAMELVGRHLGIPREDMIAFGDGPNDLDMLSYAGIGVAMGNAVPGAKAAADYITDDVDRDGIYHAMKKLLNW